MSVFPVPVSTRRTSVLVVSRKTFPLVFLTISTNGPPNSVTVSMKSRNSSRITVSGRPEPRVLVS